MSALFRSEKLVIISLILVVTFTLSYFYWKNSVVTVANKHDIIIEYEGENSISGPDSLNQRFIQRFKIDDQVLNIV